MADWLLGLIELVDFTDLKSQFCHLKRELKCAFLWSPIRPNQGSSGNFDQCIMMRIPRGGAVTLDKYQFNGSISSVKEQTITLKGLFFLPLSTCSGKS